MYASIISESMEAAISETKRRRDIQEEYNKKNGIVPKTIIKEIRDLISNVDTDVDNSKSNKNISHESLEQQINRLEREMKEAAKSLDFERAMEIRDLLFELKSGE